VFDLSPIQILIVLGIALLVFGPRRLPELGRTLARGLREFRSATQLSLSDEPEPASQAPEPEPDAGEDGDDGLSGVIVPGDAPPSPDGTDGDEEHPRPSS